MAYVQLSTDTLTVVGVFSGPQPGYTGFATIADNDPRLLAFLTPTAAQVALTQLQANDSLMFRALEVLIDVLLTKGTIVASDFPPAVRNLYQTRKALRNSAGVP